MRPIQQEIISTLTVKSTIDVPDEIRQRINFLKEYMLTYPFLETYVLGISGGQDSSLAGKLAQLAVTELREQTGNKAYRFIAVPLPYGVQVDEDDVLRALDFIHPDEIIRIDIKPAVDAAVFSLKIAGTEITDFNKGNIKARQRMIMQYAVAGENRGAVIGTDHAAENVTGFFTKFGDGGADILPLFPLTKGQGKELLKELGAHPKIYTKIPTADLEDNKPQLADEAALGVTYEQIDNYLLGKDIAPEAAKRIEGWYSKTMHKRHLPITINDEFWKRDVLVK